MKTQGARAMPEQKPGRSEQVVVTPWALIDAVERRFGNIAFDLAATSYNCRCRWESRLRFGPGSELGEDALAQDWTEVAGNAWLNPPYGNISPWAAKCAASGSADRTIFFLVPASVGSNWWAKHVHDMASHVLFLRPRLTFEGHTQPYPKDCALCVYGESVDTRYECWAWR